ncbi:hypothetical protein KJ810_01965 [Patescibacteria group bacterium]|nr:hypothetical protein [Patescibacteria group bacterium]MBU2235717.1 hypothetical protein [Patescibacteria group bacterium]
MSSYSEGQTHQLMESLQDNKWPAGDITKLGQAKPEQHQGIRDVLNGQAVITYPDCVWREQDGVSYFSVTSDGKTGPEWIVHLEAKGDRVSDYAKSLLCSSNFQPTSGVTYNIAVLQGKLFNDRNRITKKILKSAKERQLTTPNAEVACLIRDKFTDQEIEAMGLVWIITMHEPIKDSDGDPNLLCVPRLSDGRWLDAFYGHPDRGWYRDSGFAFVASQVSPQS